MLAVDVIDGVAMVIFREKAMTTSRMAKWRHGRWVVKSVAVRRGTVGMSTLLLSGGKVSQF